MTSSPTVRSMVMLAVLAVSALESAPCASAFATLPRALVRPQAALKYRAEDKNDVDVAPAGSTASDVSKPEGKATAVAKGTVNAPIEEAWKVFRSFSNMDQWMPVYGEWEATGDSVGDTRTFNFKDQPTFFTTERLVGLDDSQYKMKYTLVDCKGSPVPIESIDTIVTFTANDDVTEVDWRSWTKSPMVDLIKGRQAAGYAGGIAALDRYLNPSLGTVDVTIKSADNLDGDFLSSSYATLMVTDADPEQVHAKEWGTSPEFDAKPVQFSLLKPDSKLYMNVMLTKYGVDTPVGYAVFDIQKSLKSGETVTETFQLEGSNDATLTVEMELNLRQGSVLPQSKAQKNLATLVALQQSVERVRDRIVTIGKLAGEPEKSVWEYERKSGLPKSVKGLPRSEVLPPHKIALMVDAIAEYAYTQFQLVQRLLPVRNSYDRYAAYFAPEGEEYVPIPQILKDMTWSTDDEFIRQIFAGLNPLQVEVVKNKNKAGLPSKLQELKAKDGSDVDKLISEGRLYVLDYSVLKDLDLNRNGVTLYAPTMLIYRTGGDKLDVLGIMLEPRRDDAPVYTPDSETPNKFLLAKCHVACADNQVHQFTYHLGYAHLATEPLAIASHNVLEKNSHPLGMFLKPHFRDNIGINYLARQTLVADEDAITDHTFATGTAQGVSMVVDAFKSYNFLESGLPDELRRRGFERSDDLKVYRYRDDGWLVWDTLWKYAEDMVNELYGTDNDVTADKVVQEWAREASGSDTADVQGFPESITTKYILTKVLTTIIWQASALHSALNYIQYPYTATPINRAASIFGPVPDGEADITEQDILDVIPGGLDDENNRGLTLSIFQGLLSWLLRTPENPTLDEVGSPIPNRNNPIEWVEFRSKYPQVYYNLDQNLAVVEKIIEERNKGLASPYEVLLPSHIAASINI